MQRPALRQLREIGGSKRRDISIGITAYKSLQRLGKLRRIILRHIAQSLQEHELRHHTAHGIVLTHLPVDLMNPVIIVGEICGIGLIVELVFHLRHPHQLVHIARIRQCLTLTCVREFTEDKIAEMRGHSLIAGTGIHEIHIVVRIKAIHIIGITLQQLAELIFGSRDIIELIFQYDTHIVESLLDDIIGCLTLGRSRRDLTQIVFREMRIGGMLSSLTLSRRFLGRGIVAIRIRHSIITLCFVAIRIRERHIDIFVATTPVILQTSAAPTFLELSAAGITGGLVIEIPRLIGVERECCRRGCRPLLQTGSGCCLLSEISLTRSIFRFLLLTLFEVGDYLVDHLTLLLRRHVGKSEQ